MHSISCSISLFPALFSTSLNGLYPLLYSLLYSLLALNGLYHLLSSPDLPRVFLILVLLFRLGFSLWLLLLLWLLLFARFFHCVNILSRTIFIMNSITSVSVFFGHYFSTCWLFLPSPFSLEDLVSPLALESCLEDEPPCFFWLPFIYKSKSDSYTLYICTLIHL